MHYAALPGIGLAAPNHIDVVIAEAQGLVAGLGCLPCEVHLVVTVRPVDVFGLQALYGRQLNEVGVVGEVAHVVSHAVARRLGLHHCLHPIIIGSVGHFVVGEAYDGLAGRLVVGSLVHPDGANEVAFTVNVERHHAVGNCKQGRVEAYHCRVEPFLNRGYGHSLDHIVGNHLRIIRHGGQAVGAPIAAHVHVSHLAHTVRVAIDTLVDNAVVGRLLAVVDVGAVVLHDGVVAPCPALNLGGRGLLGVIILGCLHLVVLGVVFNHGPELVRAPETVADDCLRLVEAHEV